MTKQPADETSYLDKQSVQLDEALETVRRHICSPALPNPEPPRTPGPLAQPTPEWVFKTSAEQSTDGGLFDWTNGLTLNGPRIPPPEPDQSHGEAVRAIVELREGMARMEGRRQARVSGTRAAIEARQTQAEERRKAVLLLCNENGWRPDAREIAHKIELRLWRDDRFRDKDDKRLYAVSRRTVANDLTILARTSFSPTE
jgi:hypothetical protein